MSLPSVVTTLLVCSAALTIGAIQERAAESAPPLQEADSTVIFFLVDNSASLPPLDPAGRRREALEKIFALLREQPHRLILFGGHQETSIDRPDLYNSNGQWTDFYFAFHAVEELMATYPPDTRFKIILVTDGIHDPNPGDWQNEDLPVNADLKRASLERTVALVTRLRAPLYVILVGDRTDSAFIDDLVRGANGEWAAQSYVQRLSQFFDNNGVLLQRFVFRADPEGGLPLVEAVVRRIVAPPDARIEVSLAAALIVVVAVVVGIGVRSFPGSGDREIVDLGLDRPVHVAVDRFRRLSSGVPAWSWRGLSLLDSTREAAASLTLHQLNQEFPPDGFDLSRLDPTTRRLVVLPLPALHEELEKLQKSGNKDEMIFALNLDYAARNFSPTRAEKILTASVAERRKDEPMEFLHAKIHLLFDDTLYQRLTAPRVSCILFGQGGAKRDLRRGNRVRIGHYHFAVTDVALGGKKDGRLVLSYERVPSRLGLKTMIPGFLQRALRFRRCHERLVA